MHRLNREFFRFLLIGGGVYGLELTIFFGFHFLSPLSIYVSNVIARSIAGSCGYFAHRSFTFQVCDGALIKKGELVKYWGLMVFTVPFNTTLLSLFLFLFNDVWSKLLGDVVTVIVSFYVSKLFIFQKKESAISN